MLISPQNYVIPRAFSLTEPCTNNVAEYNALLIGMQLAKEIGVKYLEAYGDSKLVVNQVRGEYEVRHEDLVPYHRAMIKLAEKFEGFFIDHVPRRQNAHANALASLATSLALPAEMTEKVLVANRDLYCLGFSLEEVKTITDIMEILEISSGPEPRDWRFPYIDLSYMTYFRMTLKRQRQSRGNLLDSITMQSVELGIDDCMMESY